MAVLAPLVVPLYRDRADAGRQLGARLVSLADERPIVVALPRGGVPVGFEVAAALGAPLDVLVVRKLGAPLQPELGVGAIAEEDVTIVNPDLIDALAIETDELRARVEAERAELERRVRLYRGELEPVTVRDRRVILVDDGIATGGTAIAAARALRRRGAARIVLAVPVGPPGLEARVGDEVDEVICLESPADFFVVGACRVGGGGSRDGRYLRPPFRTARAVFPQAALTGHSPSGGSSPPCSGSVAGG